MNKADLIDVVLLKPHTHAGRNRVATETISVTQQEADFLIKHGVAKSVAAPKLEKGKQNGTRS